MVFDKEVSLGSGFELINMKTTGLLGCNKLVFKINDNS